MKTKDNSFMGFPAAEYAGSCAIRPFAQFLDYPDPCGWSRRGDVSH